MSNALSPQAGKQALAAQMNVDVMIYGGSAGCVDGTTEYLTTEGWKAFKDYTQGDKVATYYPEKDELSFTTGVGYVKLPCSDMRTLRGKGMEMSLSEEHKVLYWNDLNRGNPKTLPWREVLERHTRSKTKGWTGKIRTAFTKVVGVDGMEMNEGDLRLQVAVMADGRIVKEGKNNYTQMRFSKERKYNRLISLCNTFNLPYKDNGCSVNTQYSNNKSHEVIVWPVSNEKRFTKDFYNCSQDQLDIIFSEVYHWDGSIVNNGKTFRYFSKYKEDCDFIQYVFASQGMNTSVVYDDREGKESWTTNGQRSGEGFRSFANKDRKAQITLDNTSDGFKYCFTTESGFFIARQNGKIFLTGNSGKSRLLLLKAGYYAHNDPNFEGVMFRRTSPPLKAAGGLFSEAKKLYQPLGTRVREKDMEIIFNGTKNKKGGNLKFTHLEHEKDAEGNHQGLQYSFVGFDELTHFEQSQFLYLIGRMRSAAESDSFLLATTNPDIDSWVFSWIEWYLDDKGYFDEKKLGVIRYFVIVDDTPVFGNSAEALAEEYPDLCYIYNPVEDTTVYVPPMTFCFIGGTIFDNPSLIRANPKYLSALKAQTKVNRARLLDGNWFARPEGSNLFNRDWLHKAERVPSGLTVRAWDLAHSEPSDKNRYPDFTASVGMVKTKDGEYYIYGGYDPDIKDSKTDVVGRFRKRFGDRNIWMLQQARYDGEDTTVLLPKESGAGKGQYEELVKMFVNEGFSVKGSEVGNQKGAKVKRFSTFSSACQNGLVHIVESSFENKATLEAFYKELEAFDGSPSTAAVKDDWVDCCSDCFAGCQKVRVNKAFALPSINAPTLLHSHRSRIK